MHTHEDNLQPIHLTEAEAFALLELCLGGAAAKAEAEVVLRKVSDLVRWFISNQLIREFVPVG